MSENKELIHQLLHNQYNLGVKATEAARSINAAIGEEVVTNRTAQLWFKQFREGRSTAKRKKGSGRPPTVAKRVLAQRLRRNPNSNPTELAVGHCSRMTAWRWLRSSEYKPKKSKWVPHDLTEENKENRKNACLRLLARHRRGRLLTRIVTGDETWINYDGNVRKVVWRKKDKATALTPKPDKHCKKQMLCVWWSMRGIVHWELLEPGTSVNAKKYRQQLKSVETALKALRALGRENRKTVFLHDNAPPHRAKKTCRLIKEKLRWELLEQPPYSPDLAPSDYHLFRSLKNFLRGKKFENPDQVMAALHQYFASKDGTKFYEVGIKKLPGRWRNVSQNQGNYFIE